MSETGERNIVLGYGETEEGTAVFRFSTTRDNPAVTLTITVNAADDDALNQWNALLGAVLSEGAQRWLAEVTAAAADRVAEETTADEMQEALDQTRDDLLRQGLDEAEADEALAPVAARVAAKRLAEEAAG